MLLLLHNITASGVHFGSLFCVGISGNDLKSAVRSMNIFLCRNISIESDFVLQCDQIGRILERSLPQMFLQKLPNNW